MYAQLFLLTFVFAATASGAVVKRQDITFFQARDSQWSEIQLNSKNELKISKKSKVVLVMHGWSQNRTALFVEIVSAAYLSRDFTVIAVDYSKTSKKSYPTAVEEISQVGEIIADFISGFLTDKGIPLKNIILCGHSLGGQLSSFVGKSYFKKTSKKLFSIIALDPAGPLFFVTSSNRLTEKDAKTVMVIHTDISKWGYSLPCGSIDVYPNGGGAYPQPGCPDLSRNEMAFCSHHKSYEYYAYALEHPNTLIAKQCSGYGLYLTGACQNFTSIDIGGDFVGFEPGRYYLTTKAAPPYEI